MSKKVQLHWMDNRAKPKIVTWGNPWGKGKVCKNDKFVLRTNQGKEIPITSSANAFWPDGSLKWTVHTADLREENEYFSEDYILEAVKEDEKILNKIDHGIEIQTNDSSIIVDAGITKAIFPKSGRHIIEDVIVDHKNTVTYGESICIIEDTGKKETTYKSHILNITVEQQNMLKAVIKVEGTHKDHKTGKTIIPFILRFNFNYGDPEIKMTHTFLYDGDESKELLKGLGLQFNAPIDGELHNRHIKMVGEHGVFHEASQLLLSWRPKIDPEIYTKQCQGQLLSLRREEDSVVYEAIEDITIWDSYRLYQSAPGHFKVTKRTGKEQCSYIDSVQGKRAKGLVYVGGESGGVALGMKDFWQKCPSSIWVEGLSKNEMQMTAWIWSYESEAMDFRHYDIVAHASAYYEGFDFIGASAYGIANTSELTLIGFNEKSIATDEELTLAADQMQKPAMLLADPEYYHSIKVLGEWSLIEKDTPAKKWMEEQLDLAFDFYKKEVDQRDWYGLFNYGDFMHTYDKDRHTWRYDMGGYAWQNTELVPTLWLWYAFLRSGREDIFTVAEAMSRHCSEVDTYHLGKYKGIGSRHNVSHWGCSCKEPRIAMAGHHRLYYYLTGDHRMGEILDEVKDGDFATLETDPLGLFYEKEKMVYKTHARVGPDWSTYCSNWLTAWERGDNSYKEKIMTGIKDLQKAPLGLISGSDFEYDPASGHLRYFIENASGGSHLTVCMGGPQTWIELADVLEDETWTEMIAHYGDFYFAPLEEKMARSNGIVKTRDWPLPYMASAMGMYGARYYKNQALGKEVWDTLIDELVGASAGEGFKTTQVKNFFNNETLEEIPWISTNFTAQWCLNIINCLELGKDYIPQAIENVDI